MLRADVFNLFNQQRALDYDPDTQTSFPVVNPDFGQPSRANLAQLQSRGKSVWAFATSSQTDLGTQGVGLCVRGFTRTQGMW